jgi:DivIVA domain-containing protein
MPLTPAEVHNVAFKKPPIGKRGYDEEEVDAFLDIVEVELARLIEENNDLRNAGGAASGGATAVRADNSAELKSAREENAQLQNRVKELERTVGQSKDGAQQQVVQLQNQLAQTEKQLNENRKQLEQAQQSLTEAQRAAQTAQTRNANVAKQDDAPAGGSSAEHHAQAVQMLALAQQTADQHLAQSKAEAERLVNEARTNASATLADANEKSNRQLADADARAKQLHSESSARAAQTVQDAEQRAATITAQFEQRKAALERRVEELRTFEREYRTRLKSYLESQLRDLDASGKAEPANNANGEYADAQQG